MANVSTLFEDSKDNPKGSKQSRSQERFELLMSDHIPMIVEQLESAYESMHDELLGRSPSYMNHLSKSVRMNEQIRGKIIDLYGDKVKRLSYNRFGLFLEGYVFLFKKLDKHGMPSNIPTRNSVMLTSKGKLNFPGEPELIFIGYNTDPGWNGIKIIKAVKILDHEVQWWSNLTALASKAMRLLEPKQVIETDDSNLVVTPKSKKQKKAG